MQTSQPITSFPLSWPVGWKRSTARKNASFGKVITNYRSSYASKDKKSLVIHDGTTRVLATLEAMRVDRQDVIISTNVRTRLDGLPRSGEREPDDPGAAVYWREGDRPMRCMAIDRYSTVADNLAAIAATLDALRAIERHGGAEILDRAFTGFKALPADTSAPEWWSVLHVPATAIAEEIEAAFKREAKAAHPDMPGGSEAAMTALNAARVGGLAARQAGA